MNEICKVGRGRLKSKDRKHSPECHSLFTYKMFTPVIALAKNLGQIISLPFRMQPTSFAEVRKWRVVSKPFNEVSGLCANPQHKSTSSLALGDLAYSSFASSSCPWCSSLTLKAFNVEKLLWSCKHDPSTAR